MQFSALQAFWPGNSALSDHLLPTVQEHLAPSFALFPGQNEQLAMSLAHLLAQKAKALQGI